jgi:hypothetical protein
MTMPAWQNWRHMSRALTRELWRRACIAHAQRGWSSLGRNTSALRVVDHLSAGCICGRHRHCAVWRERSPVAALLAEYGPHLSLGTAAAFCQKADESSLSRPLQLVSPSNVLALPPHAFLPAIMNAPVSPSPPTQQPPHTVNGCMFSTTTACIVRTRTTDNIGQHLQPWRPDSDSRRGIAR